MFQYPSFGTPTLAQWCDLQEELIRSRPLKPRTISDRLNNLRHLRLGLGNRLLHQILPRDLELLINNIAASGRPFAARRVYIEANELFNAAVYCRLLITNPLSPVKAPAPRPSRARLSLLHFLKIREVAESWKRPWFANCLNLALVTAQRRADVAVMAPPHVFASHLHVTQQKTGACVAIPLELKLDAIGMSVGESIDRCLEVQPNGNTFIARRDGKPYVTAMLTHSFAACRDEAFSRKTWRSPPTFHEIRSLSERLYRTQGIDTQTLLGHKHASMTDLYNDERDVEGRAYRYVSLS
ncbi:tyrosine-type recombinase/integrase [Pseudomonas batumici]|uniref:tyrosine-type recombinase/integrase n=1 Tax=Pseudomonas batumici TaxID=226910 RepID=UPI0006945091|nr:tyrosine-type recombinase/integrase [Pseudomonas batumici]